MSTNQAPGSGRTSPHESRVDVRSEYGPLEEMIVGIPFGPDDRVFEWTPGMDEEFSWMESGSMPVRRKVSQPTPPSEARPRA